MGVYSGIRSISENCAPELGSTSNVLDLLVENERNDLNMFNAVISLDFSQAYNEAGMCVVSEAEAEKAKGSSIKAIGTKIKALIDKAIASVKNAISTICSKLSNLLHNDAKLYNQYKGTFQSNAKSYKFKSWETLKDYSSMRSGMTSILDASVKLYKQAASKIDNMKSAETINSYVTSLKKEDKSESVLDMAKKQAFGETRENTVLTGTEVKAIATVMNRAGATVIGDLRKHGQDVEKQLKDYEKGLKLDMAYAKGNDDTTDIALARINGKYKISSALATAASKVTQAVCNVTSQYVAKARRAFITVGKSTKAAQESGLSDEVYDFILGEASDIYVESCLAM